MDTCFWIATGENYIREAQASSASVSAVMPGVRRVLFTPDACNPGGFREIVRLPARSSPYWFLDCVGYLRLAIAHFRPGCRLVFLDTDTHACTAFPELFELSNKYDLAGTHAPARSTACTSAPIPDSFPELNVGVLALKAGPTLEAFVLSWYEWFASYPDVYGDNDQGPLREALWNAPPEFRFYVFPPEFNCRMWGAFLAGPCRILHGRAKDIEALAHSANSGKGMRVWKPG